jgi:hypothetical protein
MQTATTTGRRRRNSNRTASTGYYRSGRVGTSCGQPVPVSFYLGEAMEAFANRDIRKIREIFNPES